MTKVGCNVQKRFPKTSSAPNSQTHQSIGNGIIRVNEHFSYCHIHIRQFQGTYTRERKITKYPQIGVRTHFGRYATNENTKTLNC